MESIQIDTNILLRSVESAHPTHQQAVDSVRILLLRGVRVCLVPQNLIEFWNVATRPIEHNGLGWSASKTDREISRLESLLIVLPDSHSVFDAWRRLVLKYDVRGKQVHDARIVASMNVNEVGSILTFNVKDFARFDEITVVTPAEVCG